jgi:hypothetical protein
VRCAALHPTISRSWAARLDASSARPVGGSCSARPVFTVVDRPPMPPLHSFPPLLPLVGPSTGPSPATFGAFWAPHFQLLLPAMGILEAFPLDYFRAVPFHSLTLGSLSATCRASPPRFRVLSDFPKSLMPRPLYILFPNTPLALILDLFIRCL